MKITDCTNLSIERKFLGFQKKFFYENKTHFRFFRETQDVSKVFPRNTGSFFRETQDIIELFYKDKYYIIKTASGFFLVFLYKQNWFNKLLNKCFNKKRNWFNKKRNCYRNKRNYSRNQCQCHQPLSAKCV